MEFQPHSTLDIPSDARGIQIAGKATLDPTVAIRITPDAVVTKLNILTANGGITGALRQRPKRCELSLKRGQHNDCY